MAKTDKTSCPHPTCIELHDGTRVCITCEAVIPLPKLRPDPVAQRHARRLALLLGGK